MLHKQELRLTEILYEKYVTVYTDTESAPRACILYFHGGGLLYGNREDLPDGHIAALTKAGYAILAFDYPLAPAAGVGQILSDVISSVNDFCTHNIENAGGPLPFFLWGRSAGAYLCLLAAASGKIPSPFGVISYYGYGLLCDSWFNVPSAYYRSLPAVSESCLKHLPDRLHADGGLDTHYSAYVYARQTGTWMSLIYSGREKLFYLDYTLRTCTAFPCPLFCAHSLHDPDVPYSEFMALAERFHPQRFLSSGDVHDFDRDPKNPDTSRLLSGTIHFLDRHVPGASAV